jgi:hypothetical protein
VSCEGNPLNAILSSLADFIAAAVRPRTPLARAIRLALALKLVALAAIAVFLFPPSGRPVVSPSVIARLIGPSEHDPEKWAPVFGKDHAPTIKSRP